MLKLGNTTLFVWSPLALALVVSNCLFLTSHCDPHFRPQPPPPPPNNNEANIQEQASYLQQDGGETAINRSAHQLSIGRPDNHLLEYRHHAAIGTSQIKGRVNGRDLAKVAPALVRRRFKRLARGRDQSLADYRNPKGTKTGRTRSTTSTTTTTTTTSTTTTTAKSTNENGGPPSSTESSAEHEEESSFDYEPLEGPRPAKASSSEGNQAANEEAAASGPAEEDEESDTTTTTTTTTKRPATTAAATRGGKASDRSSGKKGRKGEISSSQPSASQRKQPSKSSSRGDEDDDAENDDRQARRDQKQNQGDDDNDNDDEEDEGEKPKGPKLAAKELDKSASKAKVSMSTTRKQAGGQGGKKNKSKAKEDVNLEAEEVEEKEAPPPPPRLKNNTTSSAGDDAKGAGELLEATSAAIGHKSHHKKRPLVMLPFIRPKNASVCTPEAYLEFPADLIGNKWRSRGLVVVHIAVVCYMFYSLALVCERYFMPSLEEFAQRLNLSEDVAGATLMSAGSSAPELFTAILGVFVAKGDVGTGTIVGSAVFNILFVIGVCAFVSTTTAQLQWWPVLRDSVYYAFTVLVLIIFIYDERITTLESFTMIALYGVYILIMVHNETLKEQATVFLLSNPLTAKLISSAGVTVDGPDDVFGSSSSATGQKKFFPGSTASDHQYYYQTTTMGGNQKTVEEDSIYLAALLLIIRHKRLFRSNLRFQSAARYIIVKRQHKIQQQQQQQQQQQKLLQKQSDEVNYFGPESEPLRPATGSSSHRAKIEAYAKNSSMSKQKFSIVSKDDYEFWNRPLEEGENYYLWLAKIPVNYVLHYSIPDCTLYPDKYLLTFIVSITWTAVFSYIMVWMVTLIGYTLGIPDSVMGATFLAAGTSVPDCYSSVHAARNGMADMAVSNSIGSNVFDILIGLSLPWFIQTAIYPGVVATINSRGVIYSVILLFLSLIVTIYLLNKYEWTLKPRLGLALLIAYGLFIILTCMLEFNLFGHVNPPPCPVS